MSNPNKSGHLSEFKLKLSEIVGIFSLLILFWGCSSSSESTSPFREMYDNMYYELPEDWKDPAARNKTIENYSGYLTGKKIFIDPGHGGADRQNKSASRIVIEADVNLRVALALREYLQNAGAVVFMSRDADSTVDLKYRSKLGNESGADIFISIHHNSPGMNGNFWTNYTSTFYHATEDDNEYEPCERDLARYVQRDLAYVMRNSGGLGSFDGTYSDYIIYPGEGFSVLRESRIPAILVECAFHTNRMEEKRLVVEEFNQIQAWGIFKGIGKYFQAGIPVITLIQERSNYSGGTLSLTLKLEDRSGIKPQAIVVYFDSVKTYYSFDEKSDLLTLNIKNAEKGEHTLKVFCENKNGNHSFPFRKRLLLQ